MYVQTSSICLCDFGIISRFTLKIIITWTIKKIKYLHTNWNLPETFYLSYWRCKSELKIYFLLNIIIFFVLSSVVFYWIWISKPKIFYQLFFYIIYKIFAWTFEEKWNFFGIFIFKLMTYSAYSTEVIFSIKFALSEISWYKII